MKDKMATHYRVPAGWDFFVSYTKADLPWAEWVVWVLEQNGYSCFAQFASIPPGSDFVQQMNLGLSNSRQIVAILTPAYLRSDFATSEVNVALGTDAVGRKRRLVPVRVKKCTPNGMLATRVYIDLVGRVPSDARDLLLKGIEASRIAVPASSSSFSRVEKPPKFPREGASPTNVAQHTKINSHAVGPTTILFIASQRGTGLQLSEQVKKIKECLKDVLKSGEVILDVRYDVVAEELAEVLNEVAPHVVHFSGKQNGQRILVPAATGGVRTIAAKALTGLFLNLGDRVRLVIVDTCQSLPSAMELRTTVDYAMGVESDVYDKDATHFYSTLYSALAKRLSLKKAVGQARASLEMLGVTNTEIPILLCKEGANPATFHLLGVHKGAQTNALP